MPFTPFITVLITTYNAAPYIRETIESVLNQKTNFDFDIVISDDASTDNTIGILKSIQITNPHIRIRFIERPSNLGLIANFGDALKGITTPYIALLDCDDYWIDHFKLQKQVDHLSRNPGTGYVYSNYLNISDTGHTDSIALSKNYTHPKNPYDAYLLSAFIHPSTSCFRSSLIDKSEIDIFIQNRFIVQDYPLFLSFIRRTKGAYLPDITLAYRIRAASISHPTDTAAKISYFQKCHAIGDYFIAKYPIPASVADKRDFNFRLKVLLASWLSHDFKYVQGFTRDLKIADFLKHNPKATYILWASRNQWLYHLCKPWVLRKRKPGK